MVSHAPIRIQELRKTGIFVEDRFYRLLSEENNYADIETVKNFYMGLVRVINEGLREDGVIYLPHLGHFALVKSARCIGFGNKERMPNGTYTLKFYPINPWVMYFKKLFKNLGPNARLDPREKVLGMEL